MRKKSIKKAASGFSKNVDGILDLLGRASKSKIFTDQDQSWSYDLSIIRLYREFEDLMLSTLIALINIDMETFSRHKGLQFPKHMNVELCEYLICGDSYFDFSGRSGLIKIIKKFVPENHWFPIIVKNSAYKDALDRLSALRNFAAHDSAFSKQRALKSIGQQRMASSGAWLKKQNRFSKICTSLKHMAQRIEAEADY